jgi:hypothetical protein
MLWDRCERLVESSLLKNGSPRMRSAFEQEHPLHAVDSEYAATHEKVVRLLCPPAPKKTRGKVLKRRMSVVDQVGGGRCTPLSTPLDAPLIELS